MSEKEQEERNHDVEVDEKDTQEVFDYDTYGGGVEYFK